MRLHADFCDVQAEWDEIAPPTGTYYVLRITYHLEGA